MVNHILGNHQTGGWEFEKIIWSLGRGSYWIQKSCNFLSKLANFLTNFPTYSHLNRLGNILYNILFWKLEEEKLCSSKNDFNHFQVSIFSQIFPDQHPKLKSLLGSWIGQWHNKHRTCQIWYKHTGRGNQVSTIILILILRFWEGGIK